jgi:hypothetical protein
MGEAAPRCQSNLALREPEHEGDAGGADSRRDFRLRLCGWTAGRLSLGEGRSLNGWTPAVMTLCTSATMQSVVAGKAVRWTGRKL